MLILDLAEEASHYTWEVPTSKDFHFTILYCSFPKLKLFGKMSCIYSSAFPVVVVRIALELKTPTLIYLILDIGCLVAATKKLQ